MGSPTPPAPVKLIVALLAADTDLFAQSASRLEALHGRIDLHSEVFSVGGHQLLPSRDGPTSAASLCHF